MRSVLHFSAAKSLNLFFCLFFSFQFAPTIFGQIATTHFSTRNAGWWTLGLNAGTAYQTSDVCIDPKGWGAGLTLGKNLFYKPGAPVSFDLRGRLLFSKTYGADAVRSFGIAKNSVLNGQDDAGLNYLLDKSAPNDSSFVFQNYKNSAGEIGLEGLLTFNRLRERTGVVFSLFGGIGLDVYNVWTDQLDASRNQYNYLKINENANSRSITAELEALRDGNYETDADGFKNTSTKVGFMPNLGVELGYQVAPRFYLGVGHKLTFTRTDLFDGQRWNNDNSASTDNDLHHYTNFFMRWDIQSTKRERREQPPLIDITFPQTDPYISDRRDIVVLADVKNVRGAGDVICTVNGSNQRFEFRGEKFKTAIRLQNGRNEVKIRASNPDGKAEATTVIVFEEKYIPPTPPVPPPVQPTQNRPTVDFVEPGRTPFTTNREEIFVIARVTGVRDRREVRMFVNGFEQTNFSMAENLEASIKLRSGRNSVRVEAQNAGGQASDEVEIILENQVPQGEKPVISITNPSRKAETTKETTFPFRATVKNVSSRDEIQLTLNGSRFSDFSFSSWSGEVQATLPIHSGDNSVNLRAQNRFGADEKSATITFISGVQVVKKPTVDIISPANNSTTSQATVELRANLKNISESNQITILVNGSPISNFNFDKNNQSLVATVGLRDGDNSLTIKVVNADGGDEETVKIRFEKVKKLPVVNITAPRDQSSTDNPTCILTAQIQQVFDSKNVEIRHGRQKITDFSMDRGGNVTAKLTLQPGKNIITVQATNADGTDQKSVEISLNTKVVIEKPTVGFLSPKTSGLTVGENIYNIRARVSRVSDKKQIAVKINGKAPRVFDFDPKTGDVTFRAGLVEGSNSVTIEATNEGGKSEATTTITLKINTIPAPEVKIISASAPTTNPEEPTVFRSGVIAEVKNVSDKNQIKVKVRGVDFTDFEFNVAGSFVKFVIRLQPGDNLVEISAATRQGSDSDSLVVKL